MILRASTDRDIDKAFAALAPLQAGGLVIGGDAFFNTPERTARGAGSAPQASLDLREP